MPTDLLTPAIIPDEPQYTPSAFPFIDRVLVATHIDRKGNPIGFRNEDVQRSGMSLRDWFATHAMSALIASGLPYAPDVIASAAYGQADAMMAHGLQKQSSPSSEA